MARIPSRFIPPRQVLSRVNQYLSSSVFSEWARPLYEELNWDVKFSWDGGTTIATDITDDGLTGYCHRIGNTVFFSAIAVITDKGAGTGNLSLVNLPYKRRLISSGGTTLNYSGSAYGTQGFTGVTSGIHISITGYNAANGYQDVAVNLVHGNGTTGGVTDAQITPTTVFTVSGFYFI